MSWLYEKKTYSSEKNGRITCRRLFGQWEVFVGGFHESSRYLAAVWREAYDRLPAGFRPRDVLMFGLAGGDNVALLQNRFPGCRVTAVEWDPVMVRIADDVGIFPAAMRPTVIVADAMDAVATLSGPYDLVIVDLFRGSRVAEAAFSDAFLTGLRRLTGPDGLVLANGFLEPKLFTAVGRHLTPVSSWKTHNNRLALFRKPLAGRADAAVR